MAAMLHGAAMLSLTPAAVLLSLLPIAVLCRVAAPCRVSVKRCVCDSLDESRASALLDATLLTM